MMSLVEAKTDSSVSYNSRTFLALRYSCNCKVLCRSPLHVILLQFTLKVRHYLVQDGRINTVVWIA